MSIAPLTAIAAAKLTRIISALERATAPMAGWTDKLPPVERLRAVVAAAEALAATDDERGVQRLWRDEAGEALSDFVHDALQSFAGLPAVAAEDFTALMLELLSGVAVRPRFGKHPRLAIWGPLEARLQQADLLVLGSLNEGTWPAESAIDPWLNRPMRQGFGLPAPERKIGLSAHDFQQAMGAPKVLLTRAERVDGAPTVPSRWLLRLDAFLTCAAEGLPSNAGALERRLAQLIDRPRKVEPGKRPMPRPGAARRPAQLSVTQIEAWRRNPYAIYARHILRLQEAGSAGPGSRRGRSRQRGAQGAARLHRAVPARAAERCAGAVARRRRSGIPAMARPAECLGVLAAALPAHRRLVAGRGTRTTHGAHDRDRHRSGTARCRCRGLASPFTLTRARRPHRRLARRRPHHHRLQDRHARRRRRTSSCGFAPQLTLEAAMALAGAFEGVGGTAIAELAHWKLSGNRDGGAIDPVKGDLMAAGRRGDDGADRADARLQRRQRCLCRDARCELTRRPTTTTRTWRATPNG